MNENINSQTLRQLSAKLQAGVKPINLEDSDRVIGFKLGQVNMLEQIDNIIKEIEEEGG